MSASYGLLSSGFSTPTFVDWQQEYFDLATSAWGSDADINTGSVIGQLLSIPAYQDILIWQALEAVYTSQTLNGAEGIYLDDVVNKRGVFRKSAAAGTGYGYIATDSTGIWSATVPTTTTFSAQNGENYNVSTETALKTNIAAWCFSKGQCTTLTSSTMTISVTNTTSGAVVTQIFTPANSSFTSDVVTFIRNNIELEDQSLVWTDSATNNVYVGFDSSIVTAPAATDTTSSTTLIPVGLTTTTTISASINVGVKWSLIPAVCQETGSFPVSIGDITGISPTPTGYFAVGNFTAFDSGSAVETDAELRIRFNSTTDEATSATKPAVYKAVMDLPNVTSVRIYDNPTATDTISAAAFTFNTVVFGGNTQTIAQTIYNKKPINTLTDGTTSYTVSTEDGGTEVIKFTYGTETPYSIQINYKTATGNSLTSSQQAAIAEAFVTLQDSFIAGSEIFNAQLVSVVYKELDFGILTYLSVYSKLTTAPSSSYTTSDIAPAYNELVTIASDNVSFAYVS